MGRGENEDIYILAEIDCQAIPGPDIDPLTGAWKKPRPGDGSGKPAPTAGADTPPKAESQDDDPPKKNAG
jgi:hypothetical protein